MIPSLGRLRSWDETWKTADPIPKLEGSGRPWEGLVCDVSRPHGCHSCYSPQMCALSHQKKDQTC